MPMAFNPFHGFRRHSKWVFAGLVLIAMFSFVLSASGGLTNADPLAIFGNWLGRSSRNPAMVTIHGQEFDARQIQQVQLNRRLANYFMEAAVATAQENMLRGVAEGAGKFSPEAQQVVSQVLNFRGLLRSGDQGRMFYRQLMLGGGGMPGAMSQLQMAAVRAAQDKRNDEATALSNILQVVNLDMVRMAHANELYFGGKEGSLEDTVNFLIWRH